MSQVYFVFVFVFVSHHVRDHAACCILDTKFGSRRENVARAAQTLIVSRRSLRVLRLFRVVTCTRLVLLAKEGEICCAVVLGATRIRLLVRNLSGVCECVLELPGRLEQMKMSGARAGI